MVSQLSMVSITDNNIYHGFVCVCVCVCVCVRACVHCAHQVSVPESDHQSQGQLSHEEIVDPAEGELQVLNLEGLEVSVEGDCTRGEGRERGGKGGRGELVHKYGNICWYSKWRW